jgi:general secretion pathway protein D
MMAPARGVLRLLRPYAVALLLAGCAGQQAFQQAEALFALGKHEEGLTKLEAAVKAEPKNAEYRMALANRRNTWVTQLLVRAEQARRAGRLSDAEKLYRQAIGTEPGSVAAQAGLDAIANDRVSAQLIKQAEELLGREKPDEVSDKGTLEQAAELVRKVLATDPAHRGARALRTRIEERQLKLERANEQELSAAFRKTITLEFRDAPLRSIFDMISRVSGLNFFLDKDVRTDQRATVVARNTSIEEALRVLLVTNQLEQKVLNENSIVIYPNTPQKQREYQPLSIRTFYLANADVKAISNTLKTILKTRDLVTDERLGILIMRDTPEAIRLAERLIALQDMGDAEVMLGVEVLEVKRSRLQELGIQWPGSASFSVLGTADAPVTLEKLLNLNSSGIGANIGSLTINARKEDADSNILANPRIRVRNKEKARVVIGDRVPVITTTSTSTGFVSDSVTYLDVGLKVEAEPMVYLDDEVAIKVGLEVSNLVREVTSPSGTLSYQIGTRSASTVLRLKDGETQILAGLINQEDRATASKVPGLGEFPVLGRLFGSRKDDSQSTEIMLSITPHIVRSIRRPDLVAAEFASGTEASLGSRGISLGSGTAPGATPAAAPTRPAQPQSAAPGRQPTPSTTTSGTTRSSQTPAVVAPPSGTPSTDQNTGSPSQSVGGAIPATPQTFSWQAPLEVKVGEQFSVVLSLQSVTALRGLPLTLGFDPANLQLVSVNEGDFFKQGGGQTTFSSRIDPVQGRAYIAVVRQNTTGRDGGVNGSGTVLTAVFRAVRAADPAKGQLLSATPDPAPTVPSALPLEFSVAVKQP